MNRFLAFTFLIALVSCTNKNISSVGQIIEPFEKISLMEQGGFMGVQGPYHFSASGVLELPNGERKMLKAEQRSAIRQQSIVLLGLSPYQGEIHSVERSIVMDSLQYSWDIEDPSAEAYNAVYLKLIEICQED